MSSRHGPRRLAYARESLADHHLILGVQIDLQLRSNG
jgi:hypothetical protein